MSSPSKIVIYREEKKKIYTEKKNQFSPRMELVLNITHLLPNGMTKKIHFTSIHSINFRMDVSFSRLLTIISIFHDKVCVSFRDAQESNIYNTNKKFLFSNRMCQCQTQKNYLNRWRQQMVSG